MSPDAVSFKGQHKDARTARFGPRKRLFSHRSLRHDECSCDFARRTRCVRFCSVSTKMCRFRMDANGWCTGSMLANQCCDLITSLNWSTSTIYSHSELAINNLEPTSHIGPIGPTPKCCSREHKHTQHGVLRHSVCLHDGSTRRGAMGLGSSSSQGLIRTANSGIGFSPI
jgi:hypothetical protein